MEFVDTRESTPARDELAILKRDLKAARDEILIAKDKEAEWMRVFEEDDTKSVALSRELEDARKQITDDIAAANALRSGVSEAKDAMVTAEAKVQELTQALGVERGKVASLTRDREELIARSVRGAPSCSTVATRSRARRPRSGPEARTWSTPASCSASTA